MKLQCTLIILFMTLIVTNLNAKPFAKELLGSKPNIIIVMTDDQG